MTKHKTYSIGGEHFFKYENIPISYRKSISKATLEAYNASSDFGGELYIVNDVIYHSYDQIPVELRSSNSVEIFACEISEPNLFVLSAVDFNLEQYAQSRVNPTGKIGPQKNIINRQQKENRIAFIVVVTLAAIALLVYFFTIPAAT